MLDPAKLRRPGKRLTSPERWEVNQLIKSGVLSVSEYPTFDEEGQVPPPPSRSCARSSLVSLSPHSILPKVLLWGPRGFCSILTD